MHNRTCNNCNQPLLGQQKMYCSHRCANRVTAKRKSDAAAARPTPTCIVEGCQKPARSKSADLCPQHYHRRYRHGDVSKTAWAPDAPTASHGRRYRTATNHAHPLAMANGRVYIHRQVLYDLIGPGEHPCHWCAAPVHWSTRGDTLGLYPDHVNGIGDDNRPENLVPSCMACNSGRGAQAKAAALREHGWWQVNDTIAALRGTQRRALIGSKS